jgi:integrase
MGALSGRVGVAARALEFTILTAARTGEVTGARWSEIDFEAATWTIPAERMKAQREHRVPLSDRALELLRALPTEEGNDFVFIGARAGLSNTALFLALRAMERGDITVHGFRSTFRIWAAERTAYPREIAEASLAHTIGNAIERTYQRSSLFDHRRRLMDEWSEFCYAPPPIGAVVPMRGAR